MKLIKVGPTFVNLDQMTDAGRNQRNGELFVCFGVDLDGAVTFTGREADALEAWLNANAEVIPVEEKP